MEGRGDEGFGKEVSKVTIIYEYGFIMVLFRKFVVFGAFLLRLFQLSYQDPKRLTTNILASCTD